MSVLLGVTCGLWVVSIGLNFTLLVEQIHIYMHINTSIYRYKHAYIYIYISFVCVNMYVCVYIYIHIITYVLSLEREREREVQNDSWRSLRAPCFQAIWCRSLPRNCLDSLTRPCVGAAPWFWGDSLKQNIQTDYSTPSRDSKLQFQTANQVLNLRTFYNPTGP